MQFGSVAFFKVLIKTVLCIVFFVPLVLCVVFAVSLWNKSAECEAVRFENEKLAYKVELLSGSGDLTVEEFYRIYSETGLSDEQLIAYINGKASENGSNTGSPAVNSEDDSSAVSKDSIDTGEPETSQPDPAETQEVSVSEPVNPYEAMYEDMTVRVPAAYVREEGVVYLTFDDGPSANTYSVLQYLDKYNIKATFFVVPRRTEECYALMKRIVDSGHSIGVHSASHDYNAIYASVEAYLGDFYDAWQMIYEATGVKTEIFRFPGGSANDYNVKTRDAIIQEMTRRGFRFYDWNVDSGDSQGATWTDMYNSIPKDIEDKYRSFVLMHDSAARTNTVYVLEDVLKVLVGKGYKFDRINNNTQPVQFTGPYA
ncbi:MAG: polysaccharide deacetylase family protein [Oscillospiraceae bacterium]